MSRHSPGEGSIYQRSDGYWCAALQIGGKRRTVYGKTRKEAQRKLQRLSQQGALVGSLPNSGRLTVAAFLNEWLTQASGHLRPKTIVDYTTIVTKHLVPNIGKVKLSSLTPLQVARLYSALGLTVSRRRVGMVHEVLHKALNDAVKWALIAVNPAHAVDAPRREIKEPALWSQEEAQTFFRSVLNDDDHLYSTLFGLLLATGARIGEALGLRWTDIDWDRATVRIERQITEVRHKRTELPPKSRAGVRTISLPDWGLNILRRQKVTVARLQLQAGPEWRGENRVFVSNNGSVPSYSNVRRALLAACASSGLPPMRLHGFRHLHLSLLAMNGVAVKYGPAAGGPQHTAPDAASLPARPRRRRPPGRRGHRQGAGEVGCYNQPAG